MSLATETCAYCPRLCRHVCPVAVATAREAATPTAIMTIQHLLELGTVEPALATAAASLCLGCGACTAHCKVHVPVGDILRPGSAGPSAPVAAPPAELAFRLCSDLAYPGPDQLACCGRRDGFAEREPAAAAAVAAENVRRFSGRTVSVPDRDCAAWLRAHGAVIAGGT